MRINKYIASSGVCSRRKADELITNGNVKINGDVVTHLGTDVGEYDIVEVNGRRIKAEEKKVYVAVNKPLGYITSMSDEKNRATVADLVTDIQERIFPVGRLDYNTTGLLLMTNDGDMAYRISHPKHQIYKTYVVKAEGIVSDHKISKLRRGVDIGGFITSPAKVRVIRQLHNATVIEIMIREGKNRQVRKMFAAVGSRVQELKRTAIGEIKLGRLLQGHYRKLTREEIEYLKNL